MTETPALPGRPHRLGLTDESRLVLAMRARSLAERALELMPVDPEAAPGALLRAALELQRQAESVVTAAVIADHARGSTWEQLGSTAGITRQAAHERWAREVRSWAAAGGTVLPPTSPDSTLELAAHLDATYARYHPERTTAVSSGLEAVRHPEKIVGDADTRQHATYLHTRIDALRRESIALSQTYREQRETEARGPQLAPLLQEIASLNERKAALCDELAELEPTLADEHRVAAAQCRADAATSRDLAERERTGEENAVTP